jgi:hypothetical protein
MFTLGEAQDRSGCALRGLGGESRQSQQDQGDDQQDEVEAAPSHLRSPE